MQRIVTIVLGFVVATAVGFFAITGGSSRADTPEVGEAPAVTEAPKTGGPTPLAPDTGEEDLSDAVPFIEGEPGSLPETYPVYDQDGNLVAVYDRDGNPLPNTETQR